MCLAQQKAKLAAFAKECGCVTFEFENVPLATAEHPFVRNWAKVLPVKLAPAPGSVCLIRLRRRNPIGAVVTFSRVLEDAMSEYRAMR